MPATLYMVVTIRVSAHQWVIQQFDRDITALNTFLTTHGLDLTKAFAITHEPSSDFLVYTQRKYITKE